MDLDVLLDIVGIDGVSFQTSSSCVFSLVPNLHSEKRLGR